MFQFLKCFVVKTKYDHELCDPCKDQNIQCNILVEAKDVDIQCNLYTESKEVKDTKDANIQCNFTHNEMRHVFLRDKALCDIPFDLYEENGDKYIVIKGQKVFLRHIKGHFKYDQPWILK